MAIEVAEMKLKSFFRSHWNLEPLFMMQKWLLQKRIENRFQMNKFSFFLSKLNFVSRLVFYAEILSSHVMALRMNVKAVYSDFWANRVKGQSGGKQKAVEVPFEMSKSEIEKSENLKLNNFSLSPLTELFWTPKFSFYAASSCMNQFNTFSLTPWPTVTLCFLSWLLFAVSDEAMTSLGRWSTDISWNGCLLVPACHEWS